MMTGKTHNNMFTRFIFAWLFFFVCTVSTEALDLAVGNVTAMPPGAEQQRRILGMLPDFFDRPDEWNRLQDHLRLDLLGSDDCGTMTRTALRLEQVYERTRRFVPLPQRGNRTDPHGRITSRILELVLPDSEAFYNENYHNVTFVGPPSNIWPTLLAWADKKQINSKAIQDIKVELSEFRAQKTANLTRDQVARGLPDDMPATIGQASSEARSPKSTTKADSINMPAAKASAVVWISWVVVGLAAASLSWLLLKRRGDKK